MIKAGFFHSVDSVIIIGTRKTVSEPFLVPIIITDVTSSLLVTKKAISWIFMLILFLANTKAHNYQKISWKTSDENLS